MYYSILSIYIHTCYYVHKLYELAISCKNGKGRLMNSMFVYVYTKKHTLCNIYTG